MRVYGYDNNKNVLAADLPIEEIVAARIHPTRVDLFDPEPIQRGVQGKTLNFTRLRKFSFAFKDKRMGHVGTYDGMDGHCYMGKIRPDDDRHELALTNVERDKVGFDQILIKYLKVCERYFAARDTGEFVYDTYNPLPFGDAEADNVFLDQGSLIYREYNPLVGEKTLFTGEMFAKAPLLIALPECVTLILDVLQRWHPVVFGGALRNILVGAEPGVVHALVGKHHISKDEIKKLGADNIRPRVYDLGGGEAWERGFSFRLKGHAYKVFSSNKPKPAQDERFWNEIDFSHNQLFCDSHSSMTATRIALFDISRRQFRLTSCDRPCVYWKAFREWCDRAYTVSQSGVQFVQTPFFELPPMAPKPSRQRSKQN